MRCVLTGVEERIAMQIRTKLFVCSISYWQNLRVRRCVQNLATVLMLTIVLKLTYTRFNQPHVGKLNHQQELVLRARSNADCTKPTHAKEFVVCERLPYTEIKCGPGAKKEKSEDDRGRKYLVPNVIHFIWFGEAFNISQYYQYLALRSVASLQQPGKIKVHHNTQESQIAGNLWKRIVSEIPCIELEKTSPPDKLFHFTVLRTFTPFDSQALMIRCNSCNPLSEVTRKWLFDLDAEKVTLSAVTFATDLFKADIARLKILQKEGGIYLDLDVITLKQLDSLRIHEASIGRSVPEKISNGILFSRPNSEFIKIWLETYRSYVPEKKLTLAFWGLNVPYSISKQLKDTNYVHLEETSFNRPNPYVDGLDSTTNAHIDISENFFLHIHPKSVYNTQYYSGVETWNETRLRTLDSSYGQAARIALFGSPDLVYFPGEQYQEPWPKRKILPYEDNK